MDSLYIKKNIDVYITRSNAYLLSGRYIEIKMLPLSFKEFVGTFQENQNYHQLFLSYMKKWLYARKYRYIKIKSK